MSDRQGRAHAKGATAVAGEQDFAVNLMEYLVIPTFVLDAQCRVLVWNRACERLTGVPASQVIGTSEHWRGFYEEPRPCLADLVVQGRTEEANALYVDHDSPTKARYGFYAENWCVMPCVGTRRYLAIDAGPIYDNDGKLIAVVETLRDITVRKEVEASLMEAKEGLERGLAEVEQTYREVTLLSELSSFLQACQTAEEAYAAVGEYGPRLFLCSAGVLYLMDDARSTLVEKACWGDASHSGQTFLPTECWALRRGQSYRVDHPQNALCCAHVQAHDEYCFPYACLPLVAQGETFGLLFISHRNSAEGGKEEMRHRLAVALAEQTGLALANIRLRDALRQQSIRDPLTGLYNRRYMNETLHRELARAKRKNANLAVAIVDVDHFKRFNDTYGHDAGDRVLESVARILEDQVRRSDVVCRFGGEEFVVVLPEISCELALERAGNLLDAVRGLNLKHGNRSFGRITASLGLAFYPAHGLAPETLIMAADAALYHAKETGRDRIVVSGLLDHNLAKP